MVKIHVGSMNQNKIQATQNVLTAQEMYRGATVVGVDVSVEEFGHPKNIEETIIKSLTLNLLDILINISTKAPIKIVKAGIKYKN